MAMPLKHTHSMTLRLTPELRDGIDKWARKHGLSRTEAIRRLVEQALRLNARLPELIDKGAEVQRLLAKGGQKSTKV